MKAMDNKNITVPQIFKNSQRNQCLLFKSFFYLKQWRGSWFYLKGFLSKDGSGLYRAVTSHSHKFLLISSVVNVIEVSVSWSS